jgi:hypothetical protein
MSEDIRGAYLPVGGRTEENDDYEFIGEDRGNGEFPADRLRLTSTTHRSPRGGRPGSILSRIEYFLEEDPQAATKRLMRRESSLLEEEPEGGTLLELCSAVRGLDFTFIDAKDRSWDFWDSTGDDHHLQLPRSVGIRLLLAEEESPAEQPPVEFSAKVLLEMSRPPE